MKKNLLSEEKKRMQELSGIKNLNEEHKEYNHLEDVVRRFVNVLENFKPSTEQGKTIINAIIEGGLFQEMKKLTSDGVIGENNEGNDDWETTTMNANEVEDYLDYLQGWDLQYETPVDLGNGSFSIYHEKETEDVLKRMNHQDMEDRLSDMNDPRNYYD